MPVDVAIGITVGAGIGGLAVGGGANVSLFGASPLFAALLMLGWSASLGGFFGTAAGAVTSPASDAGSKKNWLSALGREENASGQIVLVVDAQHEQAAGIPSR